MEITDTFAFTVSGFADDVTEVKDADGKVYAVNAEQDPAQRSITVTLKDGEEAVLIVPVGSYTVSEDGAVGGIVKIADGHTYAIRESSKQMTVNPGVTSSASFVNTLADEKQITVTKVWEDQDKRYELRPAENQFQVVLNGNNADYTVDKWILSEDANVWTGTVTVPAYDKSGEKITYTVTETSTGGSLENYGQDANNTTEITPADSEEQVNLINRLKTGSLTVTKTVAGLDETKLRDDSFTFTVYPAEGEDAQPIASISGVRHGETHTFEKLPYGSYRIVETTDAGAKHVYTTTVSVDNAEQTGGTECQAVMDETHKAVTAAFTNTAESVELDLTASTQIQVSKILKGRDLSEGEFKFVVKDVTDPNAPKQLAEGTNAAAKDGEAAVVNFPAAVLTFDTVGEYHYLLSEAVPENGTENGVIYDTNEYEVTVEVTIGENGALTAAVDGGKNLTFTNIYDTSRASLVLKGKKELRAGGRLLKDREFTFEVVESDEDGNPLDGASVQQVKNAADGSFAYEFVFDKSQKGTHYYRIKEAVPSDPETGMTYDTKSYVIQIDVADD